MTQQTTWPAVLLAAWATSAGGCAQPAARNAQPFVLKQTPPADDAVVESNIVRVIKYFHQNPWLSFKGDGSGRIDGVSFTVYLEGAVEPKGVFGTGTIVVTMYRLDTDAKGKETAAQIHEWSLPPDRAYPWRAKKKTAMGWGYGMRLAWPDELAVEGKLVAFVVKYVCEDGRVVSSSRQVLRVPNGQTNSARMG